MLKEQSCSGFFSLPAFNKMTSCIISIRVSSVKNLNLFLSKELGKVLLKEGVTIRLNKKALELRILIAARFLAQLVM